MTNTSNTTAPAMKLIKGAEAIDKAIVSIQTRGKKLDHDIHVAAVSCLAHHKQHGDVTLINRLVEAMPKGSRVNALREFVQAVGGVSYDEKAKAFKHEKGKAFDMEAAVATSWTEYKPEPEYKPFDAMAAMKAMLKRVDDADPAKGDKVTPEQAKALHTLAASWGV